jgi:hypothetical protein
MTSVDGKAIPAHSNAAAVPLYRRAPRKSAAIHIESALRPDEQGSTENVNF